MCWSSCCRQGFKLEIEESTLQLPDAANGHMQGSPANVISCLSNEKKGLKKAMLEVVATDQVVTPTDIITYINCTLLAKQQDKVMFGIKNN